MANNKFTVFPWKAVMLSALLSAGCIGQDAAQAGERHRGAKRRSFPSTPPPKQTRDTEKAAESDLWPMRGSVPADPALTTPEQRVDIIPYADPFEAEYGTGTGFGDLPPLEAQPSPLAYDLDGQTTSTYESYSTQDKEQAESRRGLRHRRRKPKSSGKAVAKSEKAYTTNGIIQQDSYIMDPSAVIVPSAYDPYVTASPYIDGYRTEAGNSEYTGDFIIPGATATSYSTGQMPGYGASSQTDTYMQPQSGDAMGIDSGDYRYYDKYSDITPTYESAQEQTPEAREKAPGESKAEAVRNKPAGQKTSGASVRDDSEESPGKPDSREEQLDSSRVTNKSEAPSRQKKTETGVDTPQMEKRTFSPPPKRPSMPPELPSRAEVEDYRQRLELRLLERYNNLPEHAGNVGRVEVILSRPLEESLDGSRIRAEFDQLVYDPWGKRIPKLEEEYFVVTFAAGGAKQVRSDPSVRVGLDHEQGYSERMPLNADPFAKVQSAKTFAPTPAPEKLGKPQNKKMADWWRPNFPELE